MGTPERWTIEALDGFRIERGPLGQGALWMHYFMRHPNGEQWMANGPSTSPYVMTKDSEGWDHIWAELTIGGWSLPELQAEFLSAQAPP